MVDTSHTQSRGVILYIHISLKTNENTKLLRLCEVFRDSLNEVWRGHENGKGADNGEK